MDFDKTFLLNLIYNIVKYKIDHNLAETVWRKYLFMFFTIKPELSMLVMAAAIISTATNIFLRSFIFNELQLHEKREDSTEVTKKKVRVDQIEAEIGILVDRILTANAATMEYINRKIEDLDSEKTSLKKEIAEMSADIYGRKDVGVLKGYLRQWDKISIGDKLVVIDALIDTIKVDEEKVEITWKI